MCGRFSLGASRVRIRQVFQGRGDLEWIEEDAFQPRYNIAPRSNAPVVRRCERNDANDVLHTMKWGVVPHWSKHEQSSLNTINARAENLVESGGMWGSMKAKKRCIIPCDGYFEWLKKGKQRLPYFIRRKDEELMLLAGLYDCATLEGSSTPLWTFTIVTTDASPTLSWLHDRQPVILSSIEQANMWLDTAKGWHADLVNLMKPGDSANLTYYQVPQEVGRVGTNSPDLIKPISQRRDGIEAMFSRQKLEATTKTSETSSPKVRAHVTDEEEEDHNTPPRKKRKTETADKSCPTSLESHTGLPSPSPRTPTSNKPVKRLSSKSPTKVPNNNSKITSFFQRK